MQSKKFTKINLKDIPLEDAHGGAGQRQVLVSKEQVTSEHFEAITKGFLDSGSSYDWHTHKDIDEIFIVIKGQGKFYCEEEVIDYKENDIITTHANALHKISPNGDTPSEFYFIRVKA